MGKKGKSKLQLVTLQNCIGLRDYLCLQGLRSLLTLRCTRILNSH